MNAARVLIEAHERRSPSSEYATLFEEGAMWELNFQLGMFRQAWVPAVVQGHDDADE